MSIKQLTPLLNNVHIFNEQLDMDYYITEIEIPFIKVNTYCQKGYTLYKVDIKMDMPCTL